MAKCRSPGARSVVGAHRVRGALNSSVVASCRAKGLSAKSFRPPAEDELLFSCVAKRKVTKREGHPAWRLPGIHARQVREGRPGFSTGLLSWRKRIGIHANAPAGLSTVPHRRTGAPVGQRAIVARTRWKAEKPKSRSKSAAERGGLLAAAVAAGFGSDFDLAFLKSARRSALLCPGPLCGGETESTGRVSGHRHDADAFSQVQGRTFEKPGSGSRTFRPWMGGKRQAGCPSLGLLSLGQARESNSRAAGARKLFVLNERNATGASGLRSSPRTATPC